MTMKTFKKIALMLAAIAPVAVSAFVDSLEPGFNPDTIEEAP